MGVRRTVANRAGRALAPKYAGGFVRTVLDRAIDGVGPLRSAGAAADAALVDRDGDVEAAIKLLTRKHATWAAGEGFVTNLGGLAATAYALPANIAGITLLQCHLVAGIAHLRGYDLDDPKVRNAVLACLLGEDTVIDLVRGKRLPSSPMALATSPVHDPALDETLGREVVVEIIARAAGKRAASLIGRRVPVLGGLIGGSGDALATWQIGQYAADELKDRRVQSR